MQQPLVIYHGNCPDGFGAAYAIHDHFRQGADPHCDFVAGIHGQQPPDVAGRDVIMADFSYRRPTLKQICQSARTVTVIDHHVSAEQDLAGLEQEHANLRVIFDMDKSGAILAWEFYHKTPPPKLLLHIQDRDLWRFDLGGTNDIYAALMSRPYDFAIWDQFCKDDEGLEMLMAEGEAINRYRWRMVELHQQKVVMVTIAGYRVPGVNCYEEIMSELVGRLAAGHPFAAAYQDQGTLRKWSLRSSPDGLDVSEIAASFGGGGHRHAAGFTTRLPESVLHVPEE